MHIARTLTVSCVAACSGGLLATSTALAGGGDYFDVTTVFVGEDGYGGGGTDIEYYGNSGGIQGWAVGTTACNTGNIVAPWYGGTNNVPVIAQNVYRYKSGRFEQIGLSWLKHSFCAVSEPGCGSCQSTGCNTLGIGCADTYWAGLNADADAPRSAINATTGQYDYPFDIAPSGPSSIRGKIQLLPDDINPSLNSGAQYFIEGQYVEPGESDFGMDLQLNNASSRSVRFTSTTNCVGLSPTDWTMPAVMRWGDLDANASISQVITDEDDGADGIVSGLLHVGGSASASGNLYHYEYVVHNQNSYRSVGSFSVPVPDCVEVSNVEVRLPQHHSGEIIDNTPWTWTHGGGMLTFSSESHASNPNASAIQWATMANIRFDADAPPINGDVVVTHWRSGPGASSHVVTLKVPDCDEPDCPEDLNGDGVIDVNDILACVAGFGTPNGDVTGDGITDVDDILALIGAFGTVC